jgi:methylaspartate mutase epsilon subunit
MNAPTAPDATRLPLSEARIADDAFHQMRTANLARWPSGADVDFDRAVDLHKKLPRHKQLGWVMRQAVAEGRCLTQPAVGSARSRCIVR